MLSQLRTQVENHVGESIKSASITTLHLCALYHEDLVDAFEYLGLQFLELDVRDHVLLETSAAYVGYGFGMCSDYTDRDACKQEQHELPHEVVMAVLFTKTVLTVSLSVVHSAYFLFEPEYRHVVDFNLGFASRPVGGDEGDYWDTVSLKLQEIMMMNPYYDRPTKVLLMGDVVGENTFQRVLIKALGNQTDRVPEILWKDSESVPAKGAAEFAKRFEYDTGRS